MQDQESVPRPIPYRQPRTHGLATQAAGLWVRWVRWVGWDRGGFGCLAFWMQAMICGSLEYLKRQCCAAVGGLEGALGRGGRLALRIHSICWGSLLYRLRQERRVSVEIPERGSG